MVARSIEGNVTTGQKKNLTAASGMDFGDIG